MHGQPQDSSRPSVSGWRLGLRRAWAFALDYLVIAAYGLALAGLSFLLKDTALARGVVSFATTPATRQLLGFLVLTLPVILYFAFCESSTGRATWGKRVAGLEVVGLFEPRLSRPRTLVRALVKFLPWELAHGCLWRIEGWPMEPRQPTPTILAGLALSWLLVIVWIVSIFVARGRTPYDRAAGSRVLAVRR